MTDPEGTLARLDGDAARRALATLHDDWVLDAVAGTLSRRFAVKGFARAVYLSQLAVFLADRDNHHPDISFGWGYCHIAYTTHDVGGLSHLDFDAAVALDALVPER